MRWLTALLVVAGCAARAPQEPRWAKTWVFGEGPVSVTVAVDKDSLTASSTLLVELRVRTAGPARAQVPASLPVEGLVVRSTSPPSTEIMPDGSSLQRVRVELEPTLPGEATIGPVVVPYEVEQGGQWVSQELRTDQVTVKVGSLGVPEAGPISLRPARGPAWPRQPVFLYVLGGLGVLAAVFAAAYWWFLRKTRVERAPTPPDVEALRELADLARRELLARGEVSRFYAELSRILRTYVDRRFQVRALEMTTEELEGHLRRHPAVRADQARCVLSILQEADLVKFAKFVPGRVAAESRMEEARGFVRATAPVEVVGGV